MRAVAIVLLTLFAGCLSSGEDAPTPPTTTAPAAGGTADAAAGLPNATPALLPVGRAWTYEGFEFYNPVPHFTVVVAEAGPSGYLLAGGSPEDIHYHALWGSRWYGEVDLSLGGQLDLPLHDGKTWEIFAGYTLTARAADVATPLGLLPGFVIEGKGEEQSSFRGEYAPEIGNFVKLDIVWRDGTVAEAVRMTSMKDDAKWTWYELGERVETGTAQEPARIEVPAGFDHVIVSAGGVSGGRVVVTGPGGQQWSTEFTQPDQEWHHGVLPAVEGTYVGVPVGRPHVDQAPPLPAEPPVGWSYLAMAPVKWLPSG